MAAAASHSSSPSVHLHFPLLDLPTTALASIAGCLPCVRDALRLVATCRQLQSQSRLVIAHIALEVRRAAVARLAEKVSSGLLFAPAHTLLLTRKSWPSRETARLLLLVDGVRGTAVLSDVRPGSATTPVDVERIANLIADSRPEYTPASGGLPVASNPTNPALNAALLAARVGDGDLALRCLALDSPMWTADTDPARLFHGHHLHRDHGRTVLLQQLCLAAFYGHRDVLEAVLVALRRTRTSMEDLERYAVEAACAGGQLTLLPLLFGGAGPDLRRASFVAQDAALRGSAASGCREGVELALSALTQNGPPSWLHFQMAREALKMAAAAWPAANAAARVLMFFLLHPDNKERNGLLGIAGDMCDVQMVADVLARLGVPAVDSPIARRCMTAYHDGSNQALLHGFRAHTGGLPFCFQDGNVCMPAFNAVAWSVLDELVTCVPHTVVQPYAGPDCVRQELQAQDTTGVPSGMPLLVRVSPEDGQLLGLYDDAADVMRLVFSSDGTRLAVLRLRNGYKAGYSLDVQMFAAGITTATDSWERQLPLWERTFPACNFGTDVLAERAEEEASSAAGAAASLKPDLPLPQEPDAVPYKLLWLASGGSDVALAVGVGTRGEMAVLDADTGADLATVGAVQGCYAAVSLLSPDQTELWAVAFVPRAAAYDHGAGEPDNPELHDKDKDEGSWGEMHLVSRGRQGAADVSLFTGLALVPLHNERSPCATDTLPDRLDAAVIPGDAACGRAPVLFVAAGTEGCALNLDTMAEVPVKLAAGDDAISAACDVARRSGSAGRVAMDNSLILFNPEAGQPAGGQQVESATEEPVVMLGRLGSAPFCPSRVCRKRSPTMAWSPNETRFARVCDRLCPVAVLQILPRIPPKRHLHS